MPSNRLKLNEISTEIRTALNAATFPTLTMVEIPTGRDPRRFTRTDRFPSCTVQIGGAVVVPKSIGGGAQAIYGCSIFYIFTYTNNQDLNTLKMTYGKELFDWLADNKYGTYFKLFMNDDGQNNVELDLEPDEENIYTSSNTKQGGAETNQLGIAMIALRFPICQRGIFTI